ncbi:hypothetical protein SCB49_01362 [unidentified eubacterium SCB49]|nr:hypothetical protein SCB49_01362 [unidentified eubacterium SCB49]
MKTFKFSAITAIIFFAIGTLLFILQMVTDNFSLLTIIGFYFVVAAVIINCIILLSLIVLLILNKDYPESLKSIGVTLANIPIALLYFYIIIEFASI